MRLCVEGMLEQVSRPVSAIRHLVTIKLVWTNGFTQRAMIEVTKVQAQAVLEEMPNLRRACTYVWWSESHKTYMKVCDASDGSLIIHTEEDRI